MMLITMMIIAMLFTYRIIQLGPFSTPGGVFIFALTYTVADIITEVYGFLMVRQVIISTFFCIIFFNLICLVLIMLPVPANTNYEQAYNLVFSHNFNLLIGFSVSFAFSDFLNAYALNRWRILLQGRYFWLRSIGSSAIGETLFGILAAGLMYSSIMSFSAFFKVMLSTWILKMFIAIIAAYPAALIVELLKKTEGFDLSNQPEFHILNFEDSLIAK